MSYLAVHTNYDCFFCYEFYTEYEERNSWKSNYNQSFDFHFMNVNTYYCLAASDGAAAAAVSCSFTVYTFCFIMHTVCDAILNETIDDM